MKANNSKIIYTLTDEAPMLATHSLFPIISSYVGKAGVKLEIKDISLAARVLASFPDYLKENQKVQDDLSELGQLVKKPEANIIKLPNISASIPQLISTIEELQEKGYDIPSYPEHPKNEQEREVQSRYNKVKGSAVNPILREGNSDRRAPIAVKNYAKVNPHPMGSWRSDSRTHIATMKKGDFHHNEKSITINKETKIRIEFNSTEGDSLILKDDFNILKNEIIDASVMSKKLLLSFLEEEINDAKNKNILLSLHMKATMMKVSDPIIFGYVVNVYFADLVRKHHLTFNQLGVDFRNGFGDLYDKIDILPTKKKEEIISDINHILNNNAPLAMVDSDRGITNLHVPSDVIIDASMPAMIRNAGCMWNKDGDKEDTKAIIPDSSYASIYIATIDFCKENGEFDPATMGTVPNVGLMAQKAEEYGSHDKTYEITKKGVVKIIDNNNNTLIEHQVEEGDLWRMCQTKDLPIKDWVKLAVKRSRLTGWPAIFWLNEKRAHDAELIKKVEKYLKNHDTNDLDIRILPPYEATIFTLNRVKKGKNTISVTGNVLRDYLTDLFPILELGTSAKMLSIVPLINGGGLFETGAGGSAPKHVQQFLNEGHLRWDSLGEFMAIGVSLEHLSQFENNPRASILSRTLDLAIERLLKERKSPKRKVNEIDNRGSHFYLSMFWAEELARQQEDTELSLTFSDLHNQLKDKELDILSELNENQGNVHDIKGYYMPCKDLVSAFMRPSNILNKLIDNF